MIGGDPMDALVGAAIGGGIGYRRGPQGAGGGRGMGRMPGPIGAVGGAIAGTARRAGGAVAGSRAGQAASRAGGGIARGLGGAARGLGPVGTIAGTALAIGEFGSRRSDAEGADEALTGGLDAHEMGVDDILAGGADAEAAAADITAGAQDTAFARRGFIGESVEHFMDTATAPLEMGQTAANWIPGVDLDMFGVGGLDERLEGHGVDDAEFVQAAAGGEGRQEIINRLQEQAEGWHLGGLRAQETLRDLNEMEEQFLEERAQDAEAHFAELGLSDAVDDMDIDDRILATYDDLDELAPHEAADRLRALGERADELDPTSAMDLSRAIGELEDQTTDADEVFEDAFGSLEDTPEWIQRVRSVVDEMADPMAALGDAQQELQQSIQEQAEAEEWGEDQLQQRMEEMEEGGAGMADAWIDSMKDQAEETAEFRDRLGDVTEQAQGLVNDVEGGEDAVQDFIANLAEAGAQYPEMLADFTDKTDEELEDAIEATTLAEEGMDEELARILAGSDVASQFNDALNQGFMDNTDEVGNIFEGYSEEMQRALNPMLEAMGAEPISSPGGSRVNEEGVAAQLPGRNRGGFVPGQGADHDSVEMRLTPGEYVFSRQAVQRYGPRMLDQLHTDLRTGPRETHEMGGGPGGVGRGPQTWKTLAGMMQDSGISHRVTSTVRSGAPGGSYHNTGHAIDLAGPFPSPVPTPEMDAIFKFWAQFAPSLRELIYAGADRNVKNGRWVPPYAVQSHMDHVHVAAAGHELGQKVDSHEGDEGGGLFGMLGDVGETAAGWLQALDMPSPPDDWPHNGIGRTAPAAAEELYNAARQFVSFGIFDEGGWLPPGWTLAFNGTGAPERVGPPQTRPAAGRHAGEDGGSRQVVIQEVNIDAGERDPHEVWRELRKVIETEEARL